MPFENEAKTPFKYLTVAEQVEVIDTLAGKYDDRLVVMTESFPIKLRNDGNININCAYKVVQKDIVIKTHTLELYGNDFVLRGEFLSRCSDHFTMNHHKNKYKLVKIED